MYTPLSVYQAVSLALARSIFEYHNNGYYERAQIKVDQRRSTQGLSEFYPVFALHPEPESVTTTVLCINKYVAMRAYAQSVYIYANDQMK